MSDDGGWVSASCGSDGGIVRRSVYPPVPTSGAAALSGVRLDAPDVGVPPVLGARLHAYGMSDDGGSVAACRGPHGGVVRRSVHPPGSDVGVRPAVSRP